MSALGKLRGIVNEKSFQTTTNSSGHLIVEHPGLPTVVPAPPPPVAVNAEKDAVLSAWIDSLKVLDELDRAHVLRLISPNLVRTDAEFLKEMKIWISKKVARSESKDTKAAATMKQTTASTGDVFDWFSLPVINIAQPAMLALLSRCISSPSQFWPSKAIRYLIRTGSALAIISPPGISTAPSVSLMKSVLEKGDLGTLQLTLTPNLIPDLSEKDLVDALKYVCCGSVSDVAAENQASILKSRLAAIDSKYSKAKGRQVRSYTSPALAGRSFFIEKIFQAPRNDYQFSFELKSLAVEDLEVVLAWAASILTSNGWKEDEGSNNYKNLKRNKKKQETEWMYETAAPTEADLVLRRQLWWLWEGKMKSKNSDLFFAVR
jgi:hypothetical protein